MHFTFCPSDTLETLYCGTTPGSQFQVCPHFSTIVAGLRRSRRLQYVKKSVNNLPPSQENVRQRRHLTWSTRSAAVSTAASAVGFAVWFTSGATPGSAAGSAAESSERISTLWRNSGFENYPYRWGIAELSSVILGVSRSY